MSQSSVFIADASSFDPQPIQSQGHDRSEFDRRSDPSFRAHYCPTPRDSGTVLEKLLLDLRRAGLVVSQRGAQGGYRLARPPERIRVAEILLAVGESLTWPELPPHSATDWVTRTLWRHLHRLCAEALHNLTLADLYYDVRSRMATESEPFHFIV